MRKRKRSIDVFSALCSILGTAVFLSFVWHDDPLPYISSEKVEMVWRSWPFQSVRYEGEFWHNGWESTTVITEERIWKKNLFRLKFSISNSSDRKLNK